MRRMLCALLALTLVVSLPLTALAEVITDISLGDVTIGATHVQHTAKNDANELENRNDPHEGSVIINQSDPGVTNNTITVNTTTSNGTNSGTAATEKAEVTVTLNGVNIKGDESNSEPAMGVTTKAGDTVTVELNGDNTLTGGKNGAGLATMDNKGSLVIQDEVPNPENPEEVGSLTANGTWYGAGIGGNSSGQNGNNITINSGNITAKGGSGGGAGIGGGEEGNGSNITINGGTVKAEGGSSAAGIGGGEDRSGSNITISGSANVTATGGSYAAGIGGGEDGSGSNITVSGSANVTATGGTFAAGIGGGWEDDGSNITISGSAQVTVEGGFYAADIGNGADPYGDEQENEVNTDKLLTTGSITYSDGKKVQGTYVPPVPPEKQPVSSAPSAEPVQPAKTSRVGASTSGYKKGCLWSKGYITRTLFKVENGAGMKPVWSEEIKEGILTISAENEPVVFTTWLNGLKYLQEMGVKTILIRTEGWETELDVASLIAENAGEYILTQEGESATLTLDGKAAEIQ